MSILKRMLIGVSATFLCFTKCHMVEAHSVHSTHFAKHKKEVEISYQPVIPINFGTKDFESSLYYKNNVRDLAIAIWLEARGENSHGMRMVADVILNRLQDGNWGNSVSDIVLAKGQFDFVTKVKFRIMRKAHSFFKVVPYEYVDAKNVAANIMWAQANNSRVDTTNGALYFYNKTYRMPPWARFMRKIAVYRNHIFYKPIRVL